MQQQGLIFDIKRFSVNDGPGIRTTVFFKGCPLACWWCHNPEGLSCEIEQAAVIRTLDDREFRVTETIGKLVTVEEVMDEIRKENIFHETSGGGVTFSGGEPLLQPDFLKGLVRACNDAGLHTCLDTSGFCDSFIFKELIPEFRLVLYDVKTLDREKHILYTGFPNEIILQNLNWLDRSGVPYIIRMPVIPGVNADEESAGKLLAFVRSLAFASREIHFLPYHPLARNKLKRLGMENKMDPSVKLNDTELHKLAAFFEQEGFKVKIGG